MQGVTTGRHSPEPSHAPSHGLFAAVGRQAAPLGVGATTQRLPWQVCAQAPFPIPPALPQLFPLLLGFPGKDARVLQTGAPAVSRTHMPSHSRSVATLPSGSHGRNIVLRVQAPVMACSAVPTEEPASSRVDEQAITRPSEPKIASGKKRMKGTSQVVAELGW